MSKVLETNSPWCAATALTVSATSVTVKSVPSTAHALVVTHYCYTSLTSAAQTMGLQDSSATATVFVSKMPASITAGTQLKDDMQIGIQLPTGKDLVLVPATAGPAGFIVAEGYAIIP